MKKKQTRKSVSLNRLVYLEAMRAAEAAGMSLSEWITSLIRERIPGLPSSVHVDPVARAVREPPRLVVHVANATAEPPSKIEPARALPSRLDLDALAAKRKIAVAGIPPGTLCANCVDKPATHRGRVDHSGVLYPLCNGCELPEKEEREGWAEQRGRAS